MALTNITYFALTVTVLTAAVLLIRTISKRNALIFAPVILVPPAVWGMIEWRCKISSGYDCGDIFVGGISWHVWAALGILVIGFAFIILMQSLRRHTSLAHELSDLLYAARALAGIWAYVLWIALPQSIIHPPSAYRGGACPEIPLICHDIPVMGFGGGLWWAGPFFAAAAFGVLRYVLRSTTFSKDCT